MLYWLIEKCKLKLQRDATSHLLGWLWGWGEGQERGWGGEERGNEREWGRMNGREKTSIGGWPLSEKEKTSLGEDLEKLSLVHCWWEHKIVHPLWITVWHFIIILKTELPYDPVTKQLHIWVYSKEMKGLKKMYVHPFS